MWCTRPAWFAAQNLQHVEQRQLFGLLRSPSGFAALPHRFRAIACPLAVATGCLRRNLLGKCTPPAWCAAQDLQCCQQQLSHHQMSALWCSTAAPWQHIIVARSSAASIVEIIGGKGDEACSSTKNAPCCSILLQCAKNVQIVQQLSKITKNV